MLKNSPIDLIREQVALLRGSQTMFLSAIWRRLYERAKIERPLLNRDVEVDRAVSGQEVVLEVNCARSGANCLVSFCCLITCVFL